MLSLSLYFLKENSIGENQHPNLVKGRMLFFYFLIRAPPLLNFDFKIQNKEELPNGRERLLLHNCKGKKD